MYLFIWLQGIILYNFKTSKNQIQCITIYNGTLNGCQVFFRIHYYVLTDHQSLWAPVIIQYIFYLILFNVTSCFSTGIESINLLLISSCILYSKPCFTILQWSQVNLLLSRVHLLFLKLTELCFCLHVFGVTLRLSTNPCFRIRWFSTNLWYLFVFCCSSNRDFLSSSEILQNTMKS